MDRSEPGKDPQPLEALESSLVESFRDVTRAQHRFLVLLREFDERRGWEACGNNDCAEWLNWRCGISRTTAQEKVRVAHALEGVAQVDEAFRRGDLSYSKVRALTRVATQVNETELLAFALEASAAQCEDVCRRLRNGDPFTSAAEARRLHEGRSLVRHLREDGSGTITVDLPREALELVLKALERVGTRLPEDASRSLFAKGADALVAMASDALAGGGVLSGRRESRSSSDLYQVVVHVDAMALGDRGGQSDLPLPTIKRLCCDGSVVPLVERDGIPLTVGRKQRTVPVALRRALVARDRTCAYPGCRHKLFLHAHHVQHWSQGGETALPNLLLLCSAHHKLVHEGGFSIERRRKGSLVFIRPDGRPVEGPAPSAKGRGSGALPSAEDEREVRETDAQYRLHRCSPIEARSREHPPPFPAARIGAKIAIEDVSTGRTR